MQVDRRLMISSLGASLLLPACATFQRRPSLVNAPSFAGLLAHLKRDIATWQLERRLQPGPGRLTCGPAAIFEIRKIKLTVTASRSGGGSINGGLTIPVNLLTISAGASRSRALENSITVVLTLYPNEDGAPLTRIPPGSDEFEGTPISDALTQLRRDLWVSAATPPCFNFDADAPAPDKQDNSVKWAFSVKESNEATAKFSLLFFTVGGGASSSEGYANTIEATFSGTGAAMMNQ